jgi:hypothetical protein
MRNFGRDFEGSNHGRRGIGVYSGVANVGANAFYLFPLRRDVDLEQLLPDLSEAQRGLDVVLLHHVILEKLHAIARSIDTPGSIKWRRSKGPQDCSEHRLIASSNLEYKNLTRQKTEWKSTGRS